MKLTEVFPEKSFRARFNVEVSVRTLGKNDIKEIASLKPRGMAEIGGGAWDRYVQSNPDADSQALAPYFRRGDPKLYLAMERLTGLTVLKDLAYTVAKVSSEGFPSTSNSELMLAVGYPNVLRISDVIFNNPYAPIPSHLKKYHFQDHRGLGLFGELLERCELFCRQEGLNEVVLAAAYIDLVPFFEGYGFSIDDTPAGRAHLDYGIPMSKRV